MDKGPTEEDIAYKTVIPALRRIFKRYTKLQKGESKQMDTGSVMSQFAVNKTESIITPLRIINQLLKEESSTFVQKVIYRISGDLIGYIIHFYKVELKKDD